MHYLVEELIKVEYLKQYVCVPQRVSIGHVDFGAMISNPPKVITLVFSCLMSIQAQLQDLRGIVGPPLQGRLEVLHSLLVIWVDKLSGKSYSICMAQQP